MKIDSDDLRGLLRIAKNCAECPRHSKDGCKGHLQWLCHRIKDAEEIEGRPKGTYQCFHCLSDSVIWGADFTFEDYGLEGEGIIHECHCANCGADITYYISLEEEDEDR